MALPKLNDTPKYDIVIPSTKLKTRFRPYLVKEEKLLLLAMEEDDPNKSSMAVIDLIKSCVEAPLDERTLTTYDIDYLFCQIRSKSVGESVALFIRCEDKDCNQQTEVKINLSEVGLDLDKKIQNMIEITDKVTIEMQHPSYYDILNHINPNETQSDIIFKTVLHCIKAVHTEEERINVKEEPIEELESFVNAMTSSQYKKLKQFIEHIPQVSYLAEWNCSGCNKHQSLKLEGLQDFFL